MDSMIPTTFSEEKTTPFEAAQDRANMFGVNMFLAYSMDECIKHNTTEAEPSPDFDQKMLLAATTMEALQISA
jgi:hypothetical protein